MLKLFRLKNSIYGMFMIPMVFVLSIFFSPVAGHTDPIRIVPIGDSITMTYETSWRYELWKLLRTDGFDITYVGSLIDWFDQGDGFPKGNEGHGGWTINQIIDGFDNMVTYEFDVALVHLGTNDIWGGDSPDTALNDLAQLIDKIREKNPNAVIVLAQIIPATIGIANFDTFSQRIPEVARRKSTSASPVYVADLYSDFDRTTGLGNDGVHPTTAGLVFMGQRFYETLVPILTEIKAPDPSNNSYPPEKEPDLVLDPNIPKINDTDFTFSDGWAPSEGIGKYKNDDHYSADAGAYYEMTFIGNSVSIYGAKAAHHGTGDIYIDNTLVASNISWFNENRINLALIYNTDLSNGTHTLKVVANGDGVITADVIEYTQSASTGVEALFSYKQIDINDRIIRFDGSLSAGSPVSYNWDFGDGTSGSGRTPEHAYSDIGTYTVTLTVRNSRGAVDSTNLQVNVTGVSQVAGQIDADHPALHYSGRIDDSDPKAPVLIWPGTSILTRFEGTSLTLMLEGKNTNYFQVIIDGREQVIKVDRGFKPYDIAYGLTDTVHTLEIFKRTEAMVGDTVFHGLALDSGKTVLPTVRQFDKKIEFYGDSITVGAFNEYPIDNENWGDFSKYNNYLSYGAITARALNAQYSCIAVSGIGLIKSYDPGKTQQEIWNKLYFEADGPEWDFSRWQADIVVVNLGQNDSSLGVTDAFGPTYKTYLENIRAKYPAAHIICTLGPLGVNTNAAYRNYVQTAVASLNAAGDTKIYTHFFTQITSVHPRVAMHRDMADELAAFINDTIELETSPDPPVNSCNAPIVTLAQTASFTTASAMTVSVNMGLIFIPGVLIAVRGIARRRKKK